MVTELKPLAEYNLFDPEVIECPYPFYDALRAQAPVYEVPGFGLFLVSRYEDITDALRRPEDFSSDFSKAPRSGLVGLFSPTPSPEVQAVLDQGYPTVNTLLTNDPPSHGRYRALVNKAFTPRRVAQMEDAIRTIADDLVDAFPDGGEVELISQFAVPLPLTVIADALGVARADLSTFKRWSDDAVAPLGAILPPERQLEVAKSYVEFQRYFDARIEERRRQSTDDLLGDLVAARVDGEVLTTAEMLNILQQMLVAGNETTTKLIGSAMLLLLHDRDTLDALRADPALVSNMVDEALRLESPVQGLYRIAAADVELGGTTVPAGSFVILLYASGNRDDEVFADATAFDLGRDNARSHLAFGQGAHYCIGASLARAEARIAFETLLSRLDDIRLARDEAPTHEPNFVLRGLRELWISCRRRDAAADR